MSTRRIVATLALCLASLVAIPAHAAAPKRFDICWTIYAGWMPWGFAQTQGIVDKWAAKYGIEIKVTQLNDYIESINQYTAGQFDGCTMTNMDALTVPAAGGIDSTALITGSYSNGNDGIVLKGEGKRLADIKGQDVHLVQFSVSHYLLARGLDSVGLRERDIKVVNTSDADIVGAFAAPEVQAAVAWNPQLATIAATAGASRVFDSSQVPGEIIDLLVVNTAKLKANPELGKALTGAWFEVMALMQAHDANALEAMAQAAGTSLADYQAQLQTTALMYTPAEALAFVSSPQLGQTMQRVAEFSFDKGLLGEGARSADAVGVELADGAVNGDAQNTKLRFDASFLHQAVSGQL
ncbi:putative urea ABC transporter substrate-binding protein [Pseudomonas sp. 5P_3.1_Bac2]|uniref:putative urea ABC transporter substrate-binding protein n=1 Tax=Pseudomonas sp. 5P_3.1_Bac2 TaxID=2971617 RepID=UPI0021C86776|nr:putative urea ABC transporter substrate-binding protein [Pseudomonas sp. 5P_3.1_Bac2]MCU1719143.1 putative urea ABC transporter substrate-binding protein [Pseudomonas sp. 5P_3.1_Bac2]